MIGIALSALSLRLPPLLTISGTVDNNKEKFPRYSRAKRLPYELLRVRLVLLCYKRGMGRSPEEWGLAVAHTAS